jgi:mono/diheme cytochrome c family protein
MRHVLVILCLVAATPALAQQFPGDPAAGRALASRNCSSCHLVTERQAGPAADGVPSFASIARMPSTTELSLRAFLRTPHPPMPDLALSRRETDDIVSYILDLRNR